MPKRQWPWSRILVIVACLLILLGVGPLAWMFWEGSNSQPLSMPLTLKRGEYTSPYFRTYLSGAYQIQMDWARFPDPQAIVDLDWKIVDPNGTVLRQGAYSDWLRGGNNINLGEYQAKFGQRQRIITRVHKDVEVDSADARLTIGQPEISLDIGYGAPLFLGWAGAVGGPGIIILCVLFIRGAVRRRGSQAAA